MKPFKGYTPGPWEKVMEEPYELRIAGGGRNIATVYLDDAPVEDYNSEQQMNAKLMAAAPRMYEALCKIAALSDATANAVLRDQASYSSFDEPGAVKTAREVLIGLLLR